MKRFFLKSKVAVFTLCLLVAASSCSKNNDNNPTTPNTIAKVVSDDPDLSTLEGAVVKADLAATLSGPGPFTLFAPTNDGFNNAGISTSDIAAMTSDNVKNLLLYHTIPSKIMAADAPAGPNAKVIAANGDSVFVTNNSKGVFINGVQVVQADVSATNGVVHKINNVLVPASGNIVQTAQADTALTFLVAAVVHANIVGLLSGSTILTVFAPSNNAFRAAGLTSIDQINAMDPTALSIILSYHVLNGRIFSSDLTDGQTAATLKPGSSVTIGVSSSGVTVKGNTNTTASNVIKANIVATNGVIHVIDGVLIP